MLNGLDRSCFGDDNLIDHGNGYSRPTDDQRRLFRGWDKRHGAERATGMTASVMVRRRCWVIAQPNQPPPVQIQTSKPVSDTSARGSVPAKSASCKTSANKAATRPARNLVN